MRFRSTMFALMVLCFAAAASPAWAQAANSGNKLRWDELGQIAATANTATYPMYPDSGSIATAVAAVSCVAAIAPLNPGADTTCTGNFPAFTPGNHSLQLTQAFAGVESAKSNTLTFQFVVAVVPSSVRIVRLLTSPFTGKIFTSLGRSKINRRVDIKDFHRVN